MEFFISDMINVMQAYADGEKIQAFNSTTGCWEPCDNPKWNWQEYKYRIAENLSIENLKTCNAFDITEKDGKTLVIAKTIENTGLYWNELVQRLKLLNLINVPIIFDLSIRNGKATNLFLFEIDNNGNNKYFKNISKMR